MRAAGVERRAGHVVELRSRSPRPLRDDEVLVDVHAAGVGNWDELMRVGRWPSGLTPPHALGVEAAGVVTCTGQRVVAFAPGDPVLTHVYPFRDGGAWAEQVVAPAEHVARKPGELSWAEAAALPVPGLTAWQALHEAARLAKGQRLFVNGAGGVTGGLLVQFAVLSGAVVVATAGRHSIARVRDLGVAHVVDRDDDARQTEVGEALGGSADVAVNAVPHGALGALSMVDDHGVFVNIAGPVPPSERGVEIHDVSVRSDGSQLARVAALLAAANITLTVVATHSLGNAAQALREAIAGSHGGAVALTL